MITAEVWRSGIGLYNARGRSYTSLGVNFCFLLQFKHVVLAVIILLSIIGNIELNPGPRYVFLCQDQSCGFSTLSMKLHVSHQKIHSTNSNFAFYCPLPTCATNNAAYHVHTVHARTVDVSSILPETGTSEYLCSVKPACQEKSFQSSKEICHHAIQHLDNNEGVPLECPLKCVVTATGKSPVFSSVSVFRTHLSVKHKGWKENSTVTVCRTMASSHQTMEVHRSISDSIDIDVDQEDETFFDADDGSSDDVFSFENVVSSIAKFYLMLEGAFFLPTSHVQTISEHMMFISELSQIKTEQALKRELKQLKLTEEKTDQIVKRVLSADPLFATHHQHCQGPTLTTDSRRRTYYKDNYGYVDVTQVNVCPRDLDACHYAHIIYVEKTLDVILKDENVQEQIVESFSRPNTYPNLIDNYTKGSLYSSSSGKFIDLVLFIDAFNMVNPLGAAKILYKTVGVYMTILNLKPFNRAKLEAMHLVMLVQEKFLESCNHQNCNVSCSHMKCFKKMITELNELYDNGVIFRGEHVKVRLKFVVGDSLGAHQVGGLLRNFSKSLYFCRFCEINRKEFKANPHKHLGVLRTPENYNSLVAKLKLKRTAGMSVKSLKGVRVESALNRIKGFHVATPGLPPCLGHDHWEAVATWDLRYIINYFISKGWITHNGFVERLKTFKCIG